MHMFALMAQLEAQQRPFAVATIIDATPHNTPGRTAFKMIVTADGVVHGSIGGGALEYAMLNEALDMIRKGTRTRVIQNPLCDKEQGGIGMACGGEATVLIETFIPAPPLYIFGGGHIGTFLARYAADVGFDVTVIDARPEFATLDGHPGACDAWCRDYKDAAQNATFPPNAFFVIVTHRHIADEDVVRALALRPDLTPSYIGCIGSAPKLAKIFRDMIDTGVPREALERVHAPIGLDNGGISAAEIAISIMDEIIATRHGKTMRDAMCAKKHPLSREMAADK